ncbi:Glycosyltransferase involved in cell wall bisynthesis [Microbacterium azadirachtae]|uniref:Glycosyltransferase involved in cell wall bisynthesis n=1 Tax=Microbacterium azadirachtae TaxID=582680 RepID=A0A1I6GJ87_9MICO|nr:glycosyltransferase family 2 protein [Microbacterium azadirachtae]SFR42238.1 Glycosyltransferase involved in cell wall bisynthesis [Microbacterium azadirachtae]
MAYPLEQVLVVMPAFNEEAVIGQVITEVRATLPGVQILVVSDGSTDRTVQIARSAGARVLELPFNLGVGGAMRLGFRFALENGIPVAVQLDSDGQHNPADVPALVARLGEYDVVIGARFAGEGDYEVRGPRLWTMRFLSATLSQALGTRLTDTTSGFKAHGPRAIALYAHDFPAEYLGDTIESMVTGHRAGLRFTQVGVAMRERAGGTPSHNPVKSAIYLGRAFFALVIAFLRPRTWSAPAA